MTSDLGRWIIFLVIAGGAGGFVYYQYQSLQPCKIPTYYTVGAVDPRFEISAAEVKANAAQAAGIWNKAAGKDILVYKADAKLTINFIYDEREATSKLGRQIAAAQAALDEEKSGIDAMQARYARAQATYNQEVAAVNARGGATPEEAKELNRKRAQLETQAAAVNAAVAGYNASVKALNAQVVEFNKTAGREFEEGQYIRDRSGVRINIFEYATATQLKRVLAHEFGHAIGLEHNADENAIMYAKNESGNLVPTEADLADLISVCKLK